jgi:hypothetical protein
MLANDSEDSRPLALALRIDTLAQLLSRPSMASLSPSKNNATLIRNRSALPAKWVSRNCLEAPRSRVRCRTLQTLDQDQEPRTPGVQQDQRLPSVTPFAQVRVKQAAQTQKMSNTTGWQQLSKKDGCRFVFTKKGHRESHKGRAPIVASPVEKS